METEKKPGSLLPLVTVIGFVLGTIALVVGVAGPAGLFALLAVGGVVGFVMLHYFVWGWWLAGKIRDESDDAEQTPHDR